MDRDLRKWNRHKRIFEAGTGMIKAHVSAMFNYSYELSGADGIEGPVIVIPNHSCAWDPLLVGIAFRKKHMYFVASEHVLRMRLAGPVINWLFEPIPRKKASAGTGTVMSCLRHLRAGHSVALFAEGEQTWDGISGKVFPATGKLVKQSGATLVTYRLEGAYLALPRWANGIRKGKVTGHVVNIYTPEDLRNMSAEEIREAIDRDIRFDIWKWQDEQPEGRVRFSGKDRAAGLEKALYMCPACRNIGTLSTSDDIISCRCGFSSRFTETGLLEDKDSRMKTIAEWDKWQSSEFVCMIDRIRTEHGAGRYSLFEDPGAELSIVEEDHKDRVITKGMLSAHLSDGVFTISAGEKTFRIDEIRLMAMVLSNTLLLKTDNGYYQIRTQDTNLRKYLKLWDHCSKDNRERI